MHGLFLSSLEAKVGTDVVYEQCLLFTNNEIGIDQVAALAGHDNINTTAKYTSPIPGARSSWPTVRSALIGVAAGVGHEGFGGH